MKRSPLLSRRSLARLLTPMALALMLLLQVNTASAGIGWCRTDPYIAINGRETNLFLDRDASAPNITTGPIELVITVPTGSSTQVLSYDAGFGFGYVITFKESATLSDGAIRVAVFVPALDNSLLIQLTSDPVDLDYKSQSKRSTTNVWFSLHTHI